MRAYIPADLIVLAVGILIGVLMTLRVQRWRGRP